MSPRSDLPTPPPLDGDHFSFMHDKVTASLPNDMRPSQQPAIFDRRMGDTELSYYLPSRQAGVNDMYLHLGFRAPARFTRRARVRAVWAILRLRHPLLAAHVQMLDYDDVRFVYSAPSSLDDVLADADANLEYRTQDKDELIHAYLNGPRTLSNTRLSYLIISEPADTSIPTPPRTPSPSRTAATSDSSEQQSERANQYELLVCAMHFLGDGMALHQFANDFFGLLGSEKSDGELEAALAEEWRSRWENAAHDASILPQSLERNMPLAPSRFRRVAAKVDFQMSQQKLVGGQFFPRQKHAERETVVPTFAFPADRTKAILKKCKANGVSISAALFALCNVAWARMGGGEKALPMMMYGALNLRPYFTVPRPAPWDSYWFLAIGYLNVVLPNFLPQERDRVEPAFWHRARQAKDQCTHAAKNPLVPSRTHEMARERGERARGWAREDDAKEQGTSVPPAPKSSAPLEPVLPARVEAPSAALIGLSLLGNLDGIYKHAAFPGVELHTLTTGSRQRHGAMLLFGYTFKGKLWLSLGYDRNGFKTDVVDRFWRELLSGVDEFLG